MTSHSAFGSPDVNNKIHLLDMKFLWACLGAIASNRLLHWTNPLVTSHRPRPPESMGPLDVTITTRRQSIQILGHSTIVLSCGLPKHTAAATSATNSKLAPRETIMASIRILTYILEHWQDTVVDCTYADVPRELLESRNKELLLEKAATNALFDKSVSVISCKVVVTDLRAALREGPVAQLNDALTKVVPYLTNNMDSSSSSSSSSSFDPLEIIEDLQRDLTRIDSLSYSARRDYSALNNFDPAETTRMLEQPGNLLECQRAIETTVVKLKRILLLIRSDD